ncbi:MAG: DNA-formamidopyrimidine glycosylase [Parcubacteria group bacterium]|nr:DNA-formamidopyrimidine glycosylase [Parcubacteria group bacterium]
MPELPEVETIVRELNNTVKGKIINDFWTDNFKSNTQLQNFRALIKRQKIIKAERKGKNILIFLDKNLVLWIHLKLTGHLLLGQYIWKEGKWQSLKKGVYLEPQNRFIHWVFSLNNGQQLVLSDSRRFAKVRLLTQDELSKEKSLQELGHDPLASDFTEQALKDILKKTKSEIKKVLMEQRHLSGIGNIYASEILFAAQINPFKKANQLTKIETHHLFLAIKNILNKAIKYRGTSAQDEAYRQLDGTPGNFSRFLKVYQREGKPCVRCGTLIKRIKSQGRSTFYCPQCQKL